MSFKERILTESFNAKPLVLAGLGGMVGAGLDMYLNGEDKDPKDFIKPMTAWGLGGLVGSLGSINNDNKKEKASKETENDEL